MMMFTNGPSHGLLWTDRSRSAFDKGSSLSLPLLSSLTGNQPSHSSHSHHHRHQDHDWCTYSSFPQSKHSNQDTANAIDIKRATGGSTGVARSNRFVVLLAVVI